MILIVLVAAVLRVVAVNGLGIDHWDEGAYAISARAVSIGDLHGIFDRQYVLAPPMYFTTAGVLAAIFRTSSDAMMFAVSIVAGIACVLALYLAGTMWGGRVVGGVAALSLSLSDFHVLYSRAALTDALFLTLFVVALAAFTRAELQKSTWWAILGGVATGLAWNTKYHGWLAGVVAAGAVLPLVLTSNAGERKATAMRLITAAAVALLMFVPWLLVLERYFGGYAAVATQHARFLEPRDAIVNLVRHWRAQVYLEGWGTMLTPLALVGWVTLVDVRARRASSLAWVVALTALAFAIGGISVLGVLAVAGAVLLVRQHGRRWTPHWFALAFFAAFSALTPFYEPFPRLLLPWVASAMVLSGVALERILLQETTRRGLAVPLALAAAGMAILVIRGLPSTANPWQPRRHLAHAAYALDSLTSGPAPVVVVGETGIVFYLLERGRDAAAVNSPTEAPEHVRAGTPYYIVGGIYSRRIKGQASLASWLERNPGVRQVGTLPVRGMSDIRLLDDFAPPGARRYRRENRDDYDLRVYLVNGPTQ